MAENIVSCVFRWSNNNVEASCVLERRKSRPCGRIRSLDASIGAAGRHSGSQRRSLDRNVQPVLICAPCQSCAHIYEKSVGGTRILLSAELEWQGLLVGTGGARLATSTRRRERVSRRTWLIKSTLSHCLTVGAAATPVNSSTLHLQPVARSQRRPTTT